MLAVGGKLVKLLGSAVAFGSEELDVGLLGSQAHGITAVFPGSRFPQLRVGQTLIQTGKGEDSKGEGGQKACLVLFPLGVSALESVTMVDEMVVY